MKKIITIALACLALAACTPEQIAQNEAKAKATLAAIANGARVTVAAVKEGVDAVCANQSSIYSSATVARTVLIQQVGPNSTQNIDNLDTALATYNAVCAQASANGAPSAQLLRQAWAAYQQVKMAQQKANVQ